MRTQTVTSSSSSEEEQQGVVLTSSPGPDGETSPDDSTLPQNPPPLIPPKLLARILHHHFDGDDQKITERANLLVGKYMDTFVREAIARATYERVEAGGGVVGSDFLEVRMGSNLFCYVEVTDRAQCTGGRLGEACSAADYGFLIETRKRLRLIHSRSEANTMQPQL